MTREQFHVVPAFQFVDAVGQERRHLDDPRAEGVQAFSFHALNPAFRNDVGALPIVAAVQHDHHLAGLDMAERVWAVLVLVRQTKPEHIHRRPVVLALEASFLADDRMAPVAADHKVGANRQHPVRRLGDKADNAPVLFDEIGRFSLHAQVECRVTLALLGEEVEEVPLRRQRDEFAVRRQMAKIHHFDVFGANLGADSVSTF